MPGADLASVPVRSWWEGHPIVGAAICVAFLVGVVLYLLRKLPRGDDEGSP